MKFYQISSSNFIEKEKKTNHYLQNTVQKTRDLTTGIPLKTDALEG
jgi:hypothetical protein